MRNVDFGETGAQSFKAIVRTTAATTLDIRVGSKIVGSIKIDSTNGEWQEVTCDLTTSVQGIQQYLYFLIKGSKEQTFDFDSWQFFENPTGIASPLSPLTSHPSPIYDLSGRKVYDRFNSSIRIQEGRKIITK